MAAQEKQDWNIKDNDPISDLRIQNVQVSDKLLGTGLFGTVNEAAWYGTPCAVKKAHAKFLDSSSCDSFISSLIRESSIWAKLKHPHITLLLGLFQTESPALPLLVIEKLDTSLHDLLQDCLKGVRQLSLQQKVSILLQVALGLTYLHELNPPAVHGNLTASNILIGISSLTAKITDFGLARAIGSSGRPSLLYSSPEVLEATTEESPPVESDVFSYGVLIIHTVNHRLLKLLPQRVKHASKKEIIALTEFERRRQDFDCFSNVEALHFEGLIKECLEFLPEDRQNSLDLMNKLQKIHDKLKVGGSHPSRRLSEEGSQMIEGKTVTAISRVEIEILEKEKQLKELLKNLKSRQINMIATEQELEEMNKTIIARHGEVHHMSGKVMQFKHLKREHQVQLNQSKELQACSLSSKNVIMFNGSTFFVVDLKPEGKKRNYRLVKITLNDKDPSSFICEILPSPPDSTGEHKYTLVVSHDIIHVLAVELWFNKEGNNIFSFSLSENQWKQYLPPLPGGAFTAVSYKDSIFIATLQYPEPSLKMLNLNNPDAVWVEILPMPYSAQSNRNISLLIFGDILVLWNGTLYFTNLSDLLSAYAKDDSCSSLTAQWGTLPPPPRSVLSPFFLVAPNDELLAVDNTECCVGERPMFALNTSTFKWVKIANDMKQTINMCTSLTNNSLFVVHSKDSMYYYMCQ